ncbi:TIGR02234 family membrane protein [Hoyosella rhizosphaerae]|uniref:Membrane protein n=1 Tax=Hoyosella rhizosphaerae TaxID=1755582 RepID=A0A916UDL9_9ACTN|nr:TIGR02234 family membrane protein [Hoyosella rhizosphaerae]MBN4925569.1 TIGR02234 family membrane protein [Hoyosella rhizosphaerae]GGC69614.1 membrane protein [Hoyosella rhizosphaerae]
MTRQKTIGSPRLGFALALIGAGLLWVSSRAPWLRATIEDGLQPVYSETIIGATWAAELGPLALAIGAALVVTLVARGLAQRIVSAAVLVLFVLALAAPVRMLFEGAQDSRVRQLAELPARAEVAEITVVYWPLGIACIAVVMGAIGAVLLFRSPLRQRGSRTQYQTPAVRREEVRTDIAGGAISAAAAAGIPLSDRMLWDALDAGEDPTESDSTGSDVEQADEK